jgi:hypothetical protein
LLDVPDDTVDYVFTHPPYGGNIIYSDLSILWEAWLRQFMGTSEEAATHHREQVNPNTLDVYAGLMQESFAEIYRTLKPGRWASVVFHTSDVRVWRAIQQTVLDTGFELVNALPFDRGPGPYSQAVAEGSASVDIILNLHKPEKGPASTKTQSADDLDAFILDTVENLLGSGPPPEYRTTRYLHSQLIRQFLNDSLAIGQVTTPYLEGILPSRFRKVNDRWYLQQEAFAPSGHSIVVRSEAEAVAWLEHILTANPQTLRDLIPQWRIATLGAGSQIKRTLQELLDEHFWQDEATGFWCVPTPGQRGILEHRCTRPQQLQLDMGMDSPQ